MIEIRFYRTISGHSPVEEFLDTLSDKKVEKILWVLRIIRDVDYVPKEYFKKLSGAEDIWEIRFKSGNDIFRILGFFDKGRAFVLTNGFAKKSQKTPKTEIRLARNRKKEHLQRNQ